jgi:AcrR family transcriptional regulator
LKEITAKMLAQMRPDSLVDPDAPWQQRKSGEMRVRILQATIDCLVDKGYAALSTSDVTRRAGISRGAMHHHFPTRETLVAAVTEFVFYERMNHFLADYAKMVRKRGEGSNVEAATETYWRSVQTREYAAYLQLAVAAMTDKELNRTFLPASRRYDRVWTKEMIRSFPGWEEHWDAMQLANDLVIAAHMGLLVHRSIFGTGKRSRTVLDLVTATVKSLKTGL